MDFNEILGKTDDALRAKPNSNRCKSQYVAKGVVLNAQSAFLFITVQTTKSEN